jgi:hypothetical protein
MFKQSQSLVRHGKLRIERVAQRGRRPRSARWCSQMARARHHGAETAMRKSDLSLKIALASRSHVIDRGRVSRRSARAARRRLARIFEQFVDISFFSFFSSISSISSARQRRPGPVLLRKRPAQRCAHQQSRECVRFAPIAAVSNDCLESFAPARRSSASRSAPRASCSISVSLTRRSTASSCVLRQSFGTSLDRRRLAPFAAATVRSHERQSSLLRRSLGVSQPLVVLLLVVAATAIARRCPTCRTSRSADSVPTSSCAASRTFW